MLKIRAMGMADVDAVAELERLSFPTPWSRQSFVEELEKNELARYLAAVEDGRVIGYAGMWLVLDEAHVTNVAVAPDKRRQGVGFRLFGRLVAWAKALNAAAMTLEVRESNEAAQALYRRFGFAVRGRRRGYYSDAREDALIMWSGVWGGRQAAGGP